MTDVQHDQTEHLRSRAGDLIVGALYTAVVGANLALAYDWWRDTPNGVATIERVRTKIEALKAKAQECEGCAKRKAALRGAMNRMHWQAERIVEGAEVETTPEP